MDWAGGWDLRRREIRQLIRVVVRARKATTLRVMRMLRRWVVGGVRFCRAERGSRGEVEGVLMRLVGGGIVVIWWMCCSMGRRVLVCLWI